MNDGQDELRLSARATDQAEALMDLGRYEQAIPLLSNSLAQSPDDERLHCRLADAYFSLHDYTQAESFAQRALHLDPNSAHAHFRLSWVYMRVQNYKAALEHAQAAISIDPDDESSLYTLAWAEYFSGHYKPALAAAERAIKLSPDHAELHELMADLLFNMDRKKEAEKHYREALRNNPGSASIHCYLGQCLASQHKIYEASEHVLAAVKIEPGNEHYRDVLFNLVHHDVMDMPMQSRDRAFAKLDSAVQHFYQQQLDQRGKLGSLRITSIATLWLLLMALLMLLFSWLTGEDIRQLSMFVFIIMGVYMALFLSRLVVKFIAMRNQNNR